MVEIKTESKYSCPRSSVECPGCAVNIYFYSIIQRKCNICSHDLSMISQIINDKEYRVKKHLAGEAAC